MKKVLLYGVLGIIVLAVLIQLIPYGHDRTNPPVRSEPAWPDSQSRALAQRACFDCHSNQTIWPWYSNLAPVFWLVYGDVMEGRRRLNFSDWNRSEGQYADELKEVHYERNMPPANYLLLHPGARLSETEWKRLYSALEAITASYQQPISP